jgi:hypothetical protein
VLGWLLFLGFGASPVVEPEPEPEPTPPYDPATPVVVGGPFTAEPAAPAAFAFAAAAVPVPDEDDYVPIA